MCCTAISLVTDNQANCEALAQLGASALWMMPIIDYECVMAAAGPLVLRSVSPLAAVPTYWYTQDTAAQM